MDISIPDMNRMLLSSLENFLNPLEEQTRQEFQAIKTSLENKLVLNPRAFISDVMAVIEKIPTDEVPGIRKKFEDIIRPAMRSLGYCCEKLDYTFEARRIICRGCLGYIKLNSDYYSFDHIYNFCAGCFTQDLRPDDIFKGEIEVEVKVAGHPIHKVRRSYFKKHRHCIQKEETVKCYTCSKSFHLVCILSRKMPDIPFYCEKCRKVPNPKENKYQASNFKTYRMSEFIEERVNNFLTGKNAAPVKIRIVSNSEEIFQEENEWLQGNFPYRSKTLLAFQEVEGKDVCFFAMYVNEYGSDCPAPNTRCVNISYLDSVHFFTPFKLKGKVYYEIILGYIAFIKGIGFSKAMIWAAPPDNNKIDYIFNAHPNEQRYLDSKNLWNWYKTMLDKGKERRDFHDYELLDFGEKFKDLHSIPYMKGDLFPMLIEHFNVKECEKHIRARETLEKFNHPFVIHLHPPHAVPSFPTEDSVPLHNCFLTSDRNELWTKSNVSFWEFSSLRRAQYSTMCILYEIVRFQRIQESLYQLLHARKCKEESCKEQKCAKKKETLRHLKDCRQDRCDICNQYYTIVQYHARKCQDDFCMLQSCKKLKEKIRERLQSEQYRSAESDMARYQSARSSVSK